MLFSDYKTFKKKVSIHNLFVSDHEVSSEEEEDRAVAKALSLAVTRVIGCSGV